MHEVTRPLCAWAMLSCIRTHLPGRTLEAAPSFFLQCTLPVPRLCWTGGAGRDPGCPECATVATGAGNQGRTWLWVARDAEERWLQQSAPSQWIFLDTACED